jgi:putative transposase
MTLALTQSSPSVPAPKGVAWISLDDAARRSGQSIRHIRRNCAERWLETGQARLAKGRGKRSRWEVREDADAAFSRVKAAELVGTDLRAFPAHKRDQAAKRKATLDRWAEAKRGGFQLGFNEGQITAQFLRTLELDEGEKISRATLFNWEKAWRAGGLAGLIDQRGREAADKSDDPFLAECKRLWLTVRRLKASVCIEIAAQKAVEQGWEIRGRKTVERFLASIPKPVVLKYRFGEEAYVNGAEPHVDRDYSTLASNDLLCGDHHEFDVLVVGSDGKVRRPWITAWQDMRSRKIVGWRIFDHDPNSDTILQAFRDACLNHGVPNGVYIDNGKDYDAHVFNGRTKKERWAKRKIRPQIEPQIAAGMFPAMSVNIIHCWPYHGQSKPIERWFNTVETRTPVWPTYCGASTDQKPEDLYQQIEKGNAPTIDEFRDWVDVWLAGWHATHEHSGDSMDGKTPDQVFAENLATKRTAPRELLDLYCMRRSKPLKLSQNGVLLDGLRYGRNEPELFKRIGQMVTIRSDDADRSRVLVFGEQDRFICAAEANERVPANATSQELRAAMSVKRGHRRLLKEYIDERPRMADDLPDLLIRGRAAKAALALPGPDIEPPTITPVRSALEADLPAIQRAVESRSLRPTGTEDSRFLYSSPSTFEGDSGDEVETSLVSLMRLNTGDSDE